MTDTRHRVAQLVAEIAGDPNAVTPRAELLLIVHDLGAGIAASFAAWIGTLGPAVDLTTQLGGDAREVLAKVAEMLRATADQFDPPNAAP